MLDKESNQDNPQAVKNEISDDSKEAYTEADLTCTISRDIFREPVITNCSHTFEQEEIEKWNNKLKAHRKENTCPLCRTKITRLVPDNHMLKQVTDYLEKHPERKGFQYLNRLIRESIANEIQKKEKCNNKDIIDFINVYKHILDLPLLEGNSLLYLAAKYGNLELVETLVACGARTDIKKDNGYTPIQRAALVNTGNVLRNFHQKMNLIESGTSKRKQFIAGL